MWIIALVFARDFVPGVLNFSILPHVSVSVSEYVARTPASTVTATALTVVLIASCLVFSLLRFRHGRAVLSGLAPVALWITVVGLMLAISGTMRQADLVDLVSMLLLAIAIARHEFTGPALKFYATLGLVPIVFSLALGLMNPATASFPGLEKNLFAPFLLAGSFGHSNGLGLAAVLMCSMLFLYKSRITRVSLAALLGLAVVWSGSRTALIAIVVLAACAIFLSRRIKSGLRLRNLWFAIVLILVCLPLLTKDYSLFTSRGRIWIVSLESATNSWLFGLGPNWYQVEALGLSDLGAQAASGHNLFVHLFTTGGLVLLVVTWWMLHSAFNKSFYGVTGRWQYWWIAFLVASVSEFILVTSPFADVFYYSTFPLLLFSFFATQSAKEGKS